MPAAADHGRRLRQQQILAAEAGARPVGQVGRRLVDHRHRHPHARAVQRSEHRLHHSHRTGERGRRGHHHQGRIARRRLQHGVGGLPVQRPDHVRLGGPVGPRHLERRKRRDQPCDRPGITRGQADADPCLAALAQALFDRSRGEPTQHVVAEPPPHPDARRQPTADGRQPLRRRIQRVRRQLHPRGTAVNPRPDPRRR